MSFKQFFKGPIFYLRRISSGVTFPFNAYILPVG